MGPFIKDKNDNTRITIHFIIALIPIIIFSSIKRGNIGLNTLVLIFISSLSAFIFEAIFKLIKEKKLKNILKNNFGLLKGLILALLLPIDTPILIVIIGILLATIISKVLYIILKKDVINSTILSYILILILIKLISPNINQLDQTLYNQNILNGIGTYDIMVKPYGSLLKIFICNIRGTLGSMSTAICALAFCYLILSKVIKWRIPTIYILTVLSITYVIGGTNDLGIWYPLFQILTGGLLFKAIFIASWPETSPVTPIGQILYAMFLGILTVIFRFLTQIPEGILISILIMNLLVPILDRVGAIARFDFKKTIIPFLISWILIIGLSIGISIKYNTNKNIEQNIEENR